MSMAAALLTWIGICTAAALSGLGLLWLGFKLFGDFEQGSMGDAHLDLRLKAIEHQLAQLHQDLDWSNGHSVSSEAFCRLKDDFEKEREKRLKLGSRTRESIKSLEARIKVLENAIGAKEDS